MANDRRSNASPDSRREAEVRWQPRADILDDVADAAFFRNADFIIESWNPAAERIFGYTAQEAIGSDLLQVFPADQSTAARSDFERVLRGEALSPREMVYVTKDGRTISTSQQILAARDTANRVTGALVIVRDVTEYKQTAMTLAALKRTAESRAHLLATANRVALDILSSQTGMEALRDIAEAALALTHAHHAVVTVSRPDKPEHIREIVSAGLTPQQEIILRHRLPELPLHSELLARDGPLRVNRPSEHPILSGIGPVVLPLKNLLGLALRHGTTLDGSLYLVNKPGEGGFTEDDESALETLAPYAAVAIRNLLMLSRLNALVSGLMAAQEEERQALAYDLHDGLTQLIMASHMHLEAFRAAYKAGKHERATRELDRGLDDLKKAVTESRRMVNGLRLLVLDDLGLAGALDQLLTDERARAGWEDAEFLHNIAERRFDRVLETALYRVAQEALTNARKHAEASRVRLLVLEERDEETGEASLKLEISDWGRGFVPAEKLKIEGRVGLHSMQERAKLLGGTCQISSTPGDGTLVRVILPVRPVTADQQAAIGEMP